MPDKLLSCASSGLKRDKIMYKKVTPVHEKFVVMLCCGMVCYVCYAACQYFVEIFVHVHVQYMYIYSQTDIIIHQTVTEALYHMYT